MILRDLNFPRLHQEIFICPLCSISAEHQWQMIFSHQLDTFYTSTCLACKRYLLWKNERIIEPNVVLGYSFHYMSPAGVQKFHLLAQQALGYNIHVAYAYLQQAYYQLFTHLLGESSDYITMIQHFKENGVMSYETCYEIERLGFLENLSSNIIINQSKNLLLSDLEKGFMLLNTLIEEALVEPSRLVNFFAKQQLELEPKIDPNFFAKQQQLKDTEGYEININREGQGNG